MWIRVISPENPASANIIVTAHYTGSEECGSDVTMVKVDRMWLSTAYINKATNYPYAHNTTYAFNLVGGAGGGLTWIHPAGWEEVSASGYNYKMKPVNAADLQLVDTLYVTAESQCTIESQVAKIPIYMKPAKVLSIGTTSCLAADVPHTFTIDELETGPVSTAYEWKIYKGNTLYDTQVGTNTFTTTLSSDMTRIDVRPIGATNNNTTYYGETAQFPITFSPITPTSIESSKECIAFNMPDDVTLTLTGTVPTQSYEWEVPADLDTVNLDSRKTSIKITTDGQVGSYQIKAWAADDGTCGSSDTVRTYVNIVTMPARIEYFSYIGNTYYMNTSSTGYQFATYQWHFYIDGEDYSNFLSSTSSVIVNFTPESNLTSIGDIANSDTYSLLCIVTLPNGCRALFTYGAPLDISSLNLNNASSSMQPERRENLNKKLQLYPNPADENLTIDLIGKAQQRAELFVVDLKGQLVYSQSNFELGEAFDVSVLPAGQYIVCIRQEKSQYVESFIKH